MPASVPSQPENLLLVDDNDDANLKIADFGFAKRHDSKTDILRAQCGTPGCKGKRNGICSPLPIVFVRPILLICLRSCSPFAITDESVGRLASANVAIRCIKLGM